MSVSLTNAQEDLTSPYDMTNEEIINKALNDFLDVRVEDLANYFFEKEYLDDEEIITYFKDEKIRQRRSHPLLFRFFHIKR